MRKTIPWLILDALFLIAFNVCFFLLIADAEGVPPSVWVSYAFIHVSYAVLLCTPLMVRGGNKAVADYRRPLYVGTWTYFIVALVVNLAFILVSLNSVLIQLFEQLQLSPREGFTAWLVHRLVNSEGITAAWLLKLLGSPVSAEVSWIVNVLLLCAAGVYLLVNIIANNHTAELQERHEAEARFVDDAAPRLKYLVDNAKSKTSEAALEKVYYALKSSPLHSCKEAKNDEAEILYIVGTLEETTDEAETAALCEKAVRLIQRRNRIVKNG